MKGLQSQINLKVVNNTSFAQEVDILGVINNPNASNNTDTSYVYDLTGLPLTTNLFIRYYILPDLSNNIDIYFTSQQATIPSYVDALNSLGIGLFQYSGNFIYVNSSTLLYNKFEIT